MPSNFTGGRMKVTDSNVFALPGNPHMFHLVTVKMGFREFVAMMDNRTQKVYIEEVVLESKDFTKDVWANLKFIEDDILAFDLARYLEHKNLLSIKRVQEILFTGGQTNGRAL